MITVSDFKALDIRVGRILSVDDFPEAKTSAYKIIVDLGPLGKKQSSAQITDLYSKEDLLDRKVLCVANLPPLKVAGFKSEVLILGACPEDEPVVLLKLDDDVPEGMRIT